VLGCFVSNSLHVWHVEKICHRGKMSTKAIIEIKPDKRLIWKFKLLDGLIGIGFATGFLSLLQFLLFKNTYQDHLNELIKNGVLLWTIMFACCSFAFVLTRLIQAKLKPEFLDVLSVTISDKEINGFSNNIHVFTPVRVTFALSEIDIDKTNSIFSANISGMKRLWQGNRKYIWSMNGQRILIEKSVFSSEQIKILSKKIGCAI
jgi:hypothetical protein